MPRHDRDELAHRAGHASWQDAIRASADLSQQEAARLLGVSHPTIRTWRVELGLGVAVGRPTGADLAAAFVTDLSDARHGSANGYRNYGCRCERCTRAWTVYQRERRTTDR
ncbi:MAG: helix-turn-helix domain-containing protein [Janthinobacterium lividum]